LRSGIIQQPSHFKVYQWKKFNTLVFPSSLHLNLERKIEKQTSKLLHYTGHEKSREAREFDKKKVNKSMTGFLYFQQQRKVWSFLFWSVVAIKFIYGFFLIGVLSRFGVLVVSICWNTLLGSGYFRVLAFLSCLKIESWWFIVLWKILYVPKLKT
jgi:hypothetical protein